jgi:hypothetical protein
MRHHYESSEITHVAFDESHHELVGVEDFPMDDVINRLDGPAPEAEFRQKPSTMDTAADGLHEILNWAWRGGKSKRLRPRAAFRRFLALSASLDPSLFDALSFRELGIEHGCTKAVLSKHSVQFSKRFKIKFRRSHYGAANMRAARLRQIEKAK